MSEKQNNTRALKQLLAKYLKDEVTEQEQQKIDTWYENIASHHETAKPFRGNVAKAKLKKQILKQLNNEIPNLKQHWVTRFKIKHIAAAMLLLISSTFIYLHFSSIQDAKHPSAHLITTAAGIKKSIRLADGSEILMNSQSSLTIASDFNTSTRSVKLTGEAFFKIAKDKSRPFIIRSGNLKTTVLGTSFNINSYPEQSEIKISVANGSVKVAHLKNAKEELILSSGMTKNQTLVFNNKTTASTIKTEDTDLMSAWRKDELYIDNVTLPDIVKQLSRHYHTEIGISGNVNISDRYTINLHHEPLQTTLKILSELTRKNFYINKR